ncbi:MAG: hypothetical protein K1X88_35080 [Nannocystaceae bacterium]|nr:hypothetical protein [Nannocystaceae bacterium]
MNTPKKPGTDLAALKARLAKKGKEGEEAAAAPEAAPVEAAPAAAAHYDEAPAPEPVMQHYDAPAAPSFSPPAPAPSFSAPSPAPSFSPPASDDPFAGPAGGQFDPGPSIDVGGDVPGRSNVGAIAFAGAIFLAIGLGAGWVGQRILSGRDRLEAARAKGDEMYKEVAAVGDARKGAALKFEELSKVIDTDPKQGATVVGQLVSESFDKSPRLENLFGWQLASIHPSGIKKVFELYEKSNRVKLELIELGGFLNEYAGALTQAGGPTLFGVKFAAEGPAQMVAVTSLLCSETPADQASWKECEDPAKAVGFKIKDSLAGEDKTVAKGTAADQVSLIAPSGPVYNYAVGQEPAKNALLVRNFMLKRVKETLDEMNSAEATAKKALENYASNPDVDGSNPQPEP